MSSIYLWIMLVMGLVSYSFSQVTNSPNITDSISPKPSNEVLNKYLNDHFPNYYFQGLGSYSPDDADEFGVSSLLPEDFDGDKNPDFAFLFNDFYALEDSGFCMHSSYAVLTITPKGVIQQILDSLPTQCGETQERLEKMEYGIQKVAAGTKIIEEAKSIGNGKNAIIILKNHGFRIYDKITGAEKVIYVKNKVYKVLQTKGPRN